MMKKIISALLVFCLAAAFLPVASQAETEDIFTYEITDGRATLTGVTSYVIGAVTIPAELEGCPVTAIGEDAFYDCTGLTSVVIPDSVTVIGNSAFHGCSYLESVKLPDGVTTLGNYAFSHCYSLKSIALPDSITAIGSYAFYFCNGLQEVNLPAGITTISNHMLSECRSLTKVTIPQGVTAIEGYAFNECRSLKNVVVPEGVTSIGGFAFNYCESMDRITLPASLSQISSRAFFACGLNTLCYAGSQEQWQQIQVGDFNTGLNNANIIYDYTPSELGKVEFWRLILKEDIGVNFQIGFSEEILADENARLEIQLADSITEYPVSHGAKGITVHVAPAQMTEDITITAVSGEGIRQQLGVYSVKGYADQILSGEYDNATKNMVKAMLTYGAAAQNYFAYNQDTLANAGIDFALSPMPEEADAILPENAGSVGFHGASVRYDSRLAMRYYFFENPEGTTFTANGKALQAAEKDGLYYVEISGILPQELNDYFCLTVKDGQGNAWNLVYNPMDYILRMYHKEDAPELVKALLQALYTYHLTAQAYSN